mmetsp:Transcript_119792/g.350263  ORF Transcript_119792/g.350263 Transcript_119792/m.350263 type:complete len:215 (-) Transcript_119792:69-713(-)
MLPSGNQDLTPHVAALLGPRLLVLDVDASRAILNEHLGELHGGRKPAVASVGVGNDGIEVVNDFGLGALLWRHAAALLVLLPVVEELRAEELVHLVWHRVVGVVSHVRPWLIRRRGRRARLPAADIHGGQVLRHLDHLDGIQRAKGVGASAFGLVIAHHRVELLGDLLACEVQRHGALHLDHVLDLVRAGRVLEALTAHPRCHLLHPRCEVGIL